MFGSSKAHRDEEEAAVDAAVAEVSTAEALTSSGAGAPDAGGATAAAAAEHVIDAASVLSVPRHGSPKKEVEAGTLQLALPTHSAATAVVELAALQEPSDQPAAQDPVGVPKLEKTTLAMVAPAGQPSTSCAVSPAFSDALPHVTGGGGGGAMQATSPREVHGPSGCGAVCTMAPLPWKQ